MKKILSITKYVLLGLSVLALIYVMVGGEENVDASVGLILTWSAILLGIAVVVTVVLPLINLAQNPQGAVRSLLGIGIVVVVLGIAYAMSSADPIVTPVDTFTDPTSLKLTDTGLFTTYFAMIAAILAVVFGEVRNSFK